jgi:AcrR family transcriptional regulator
MVKLNAEPEQQRDVLLNAAEAVVRKQGLSCLTLDAVAKQAGLSKGGLLHHFPSKDALIEAMVHRVADGWRGCYMTGYNHAPEGPGRQVRGLLDHCLSDAHAWKRELQSSTAACFAALMQNPKLIEPMRAAYTELDQRLAEDGLPTGVAETIAAAIDGLWLYWVLGLADVDQSRVMQMRDVLEDFLDYSLAKANGQTDNAINQ